MSIQIEYNLSGGVVPEYGMFSELGNVAVHAVVVAAQANNLTWAQVYRALSQLSDHKEFGEATDTMVREVVYDRLDYYNKGQSFWA